MGAVVLAAFPVAGQGELELTVQAAETGIDAVHLERTQGRSRSGIPNRGGLVVTGHVDILFGGEGRAHNLGHIGVLGDVESHVVLAGSLVEYDVGSSVGEAALAVDGIAPVVVGAVFILAALGQGGLQGEGVGGGIVGHGRLGIPPAGGSVANHTHALDLHQNEVLELDVGTYAIQTGLYADGASALGQGTAGHQVTVGIVGKLGISAILYLSITIFEGEAGCLGEVDEALEQPLLSRALRYLLVGTFQRDEGGEVGFVGSHRHGGRSRGQPLFTRRRIGLHGEGHFAGSPLDSPGTHKEFVPRVDRKGAGGFGQTGSGGNGLASPAANQHVVGDGLVVVQPGRLPGEQRELLGEVVDVERELALGRCGYGRNKVAVGVDGHHQLGRLVDRLGIGSLDIEVEVEGRVFGNGGNALQQGAECGLAHREGQSRGAPAYLHGLFLPVANEERIGDITLQKTGGGPGPPDRFVHGVLGHQDTPVVLQRGSHRSGREGIFRVVLTPRGGHQGDGCYGYVFEIFYHDCID